MPRHLWGWGKRGAADAPLENSVAFARGAGRAALPAADLLDDPELRLGEGDLSSAARVELGEAYLQLRVPKGSLAIGRQTFSWSRSDIARLGDLINPADERAGQLFPMAGTGRLPVLAVAGRVLVGGFALQAVLVPPTSTIVL
mgnify:CR=1 FL=1